MKKILNQIIFIAVLILTACSFEQSVDIVEQGIKGVMEVEIVTDGALADDHVYTARFITFDNASVFPTVDINEVITLEPDKQDARVFKTTLKVSCNTDKTLVVLLNEPLDATGLLKSVSAPSDMEDLMFRMADVFNENHTATSLTSTGIPMTGMVRDISVKEENGTEDNPVSVELEVVRAVARVELWLKKESDISASVTNQTTVSLSKTHDEGYVMAPDITNGFGQMLTVDAPRKEVDWGYEKPEPLVLADSLQFICAFYTPERTCSVEDNGDKLVLNIQKLITSDDTRNATIVLSQFSNGSGFSQNITEIRRNNVYRISGSVQRKAVEFEQKILPWTEVGQSVIIDPQYFLTVSRDNLYLPDNGDKASIKAETNYDRVDDDRGFPRGICMGVTTYYNKDNQPVPDTNSELYGWLAALPDGKEGELIRNIEFTVSGTLNESDKGCYATVEVKAGNLIKLIKVRR